MKHFVVYDTPYRKTCESLSPLRLWLEGRFFVLTEAGQAGHGERCRRHEPARAVESGIGPAR